MDYTTKVLAIAESSMGHKTHIMTMQKYFESSLCYVDIYWSDQEREIFTRVINKILNLRVPNKFVQSYNLDLFRFRAQLGYALLAKRLIARKISQADYNVLFFHTQPLAFLSLNLMLKMPSVVSIDMTNKQAAEESTNKHRWTYSPNKFLEKQVYQNCSKILTWTEWARSSVINDYGIHPDKVKVVPPGVDTNRLVFTDRNHKSRQGLYNILFVGGDFKRKGGEDLLAVFLAQFADQAILHIVTSLGAVSCDHPNVRIYNGVEAYSSLWFDLYRQADAFVMPTYGDAFGIVFIEAMASGLPVIASKLTQTTEIVTDGETGFLVTPGNRQDLAHKLQLLIDDPSLGRQMGKRAREVVEESFDTQKNFQKIELIFEDLSTCLKN
ncbi:glycosyltransferase family 4 protein [Pseudanabaena galeata UHCC 0370]|uniref:Glycosyltransferase family 4 protein n=1 Tax=Pseudanabaena galeata UHCC 0370 TaxID=3110310 RepID=A0ABU5TPU7_9CYAN|nr:glycosyltransferase family 4 protein [Pseudanabaena galeata]MEA5480331.1 glycosyltransferase family 4 protein [Pseudanabaena galeata UHCC 0370]